MSHLPVNWRSLLSSKNALCHLENAEKKVAAERKRVVVFPSKKQVLKAFHLCPFHALQVVILGQDPYHKKGQAHGLSFSVPEGISSPPSLRNIQKELAREYGKVPRYTNLSGVAAQGVLWLNATLTVQEGIAASHQALGWELFTDSVISAISQQKKGIVFCLWGKIAQSKKKLIDASRHLVLEAPHPSPLSAYRGFLGCGHFQQCNEWIVKNGGSPVDWFAPPFGCI